MPLTEPFIEGNQKSTSPRVPGIWPYDPTNAYLGSISLSALMGEPLATTAWIFQALAEASHHRRQYASAIAGDVPRKRMTTVKIHVLKVRHQENLDEMEAGISVGHTVDGWQIPKGAEPGDLVVWYAASPDQKYRAWGWVADTPEPGFRGSSRIYKGPVTGIRAIKPVPRSKVADTCGFNRDTVNPLAETVPDDIADDFLRALGFGARFVTARGLISAEVREVCLTYGR